MLEHILVQGFSILQPKRKRGSPPSCCFPLSLLPASFNHIIYLLFCNFIPWLKMQLGITLSLGCNLNSGVTETIGFLPPKSFIYRAEPKVSFPSDVNRLPVEKVKTPSMIINWNLNRVSFTYRRKVLIVTVRCVCAFIDGWREGRARQQSRTYVADRTSVPND